jgi:hypothetical protein
MGYGGRAQQAEDAPALGVGVSREQAGEGSVKITSPLPALLCTEMGHSTP